MRIDGNTPLSELTHSDSLSHAWLKKGEQAEKHKYVKREWKNNKWKYWYKTSGQNNTSKTTASKTYSKISNVLKIGKTKLDKLSVKKQGKTVDNKTKEFIDTAKKTVHKYVEKVPTDGDNYRYFYSDEAYQNYINGKKAVDKAATTKLNTSAEDTAKFYADNFFANYALNGFWKAVYSVAAPAFTAIQIALTTPKSFSELKHHDDKQTNDEHQRVINPNYKADPNEFTYDNNMNCSFCTAAYDLRKRGYDVEANPISTQEAYTYDDICSWYKGASYVEERQVTTQSAQTEAVILEETLKSYGDGARGHLCVYWTAGGGHDVAWEVENGEVVIRDCQTNEVVEAIDYLSMSSSYTHLRTDNLEPNEEVLRTVRNRK